MSNGLTVRQELVWGGKWLGRAREWMQSNVKNGDAAFWGSSELVTIPFHKLEELAMEVAIAAIQEDRAKTLVPGGSRLKYPSEVTAIPVKFD